MKIEKRERPYKTVFLWISQEEAADKALMASLQTQFSAWRAQNYLPVVMESGKGNLEDSVYMLLKRNLEIIAKSDATATISGVQNRVQSKGER